MSIGEQFVLETSDMVMSTIHDAAATGNSLAILSTGEAKVSVTQPLPIGSNLLGKVEIQDGSGNIAGTLNANGEIGLNVAQVGTWFFFSTVNSTTTQLAANATFTGSIEETYSQPSYSILLTSDQPGVLTFLQYIDAAGTRQSSTLTFYIDAGVPFSQSGILNGNYFKVTFQNIGSATTTTLNINTSYGIILPSSKYNNLAVSVPDNLVANVTLGSLNSYINCPMEGLAGCGFQLAAGTLIGTITPQITLDNGATWSNTLFYNPTDQSTSANIVYSSNNPLTSRSIIVSGGTSHARVIVTAYTSGSAKALMRATETTSTQITTAASAISTGQTFSIAVLALSAATTGTENPMILINNLSSNTKSFYINSIYCGTLTANRSFAFDVYANPTVSASGVALTPVNRTLGASTNSVMLASKTPTVTSSGSLFSTVIQAQNSNSISIIDNYALKVPPGNSILITANPSSNATPAYISATWSEY